MKTSEDGYELLERIALNVYQHHPHQRQGDALKVDPQMAIIAQLEAISRRLDEIDKRRSEVQMQNVLLCEICGGNHSPHQCAFVNGIQTPPSPPSHPQKGGWEDAMVCMIQAQEAFTISTQDRFNEVTMRMNDILNANLSLVATIGKMEEKMEQLSKQVDGMTKETPSRVPTLRPIKQCHAIYMGSLVGEEQSCEQEPLHDEEVNLNDDDQGLVGGSVPISCFWRGRFKKPLDKKTESETTPTKRKKKDKYAPLDLPKGVSLPYPILDEKKTHEEPFEMLDLKHGNDLNCMNVEQELELNEDESLIVETLPIDEEVIDVKEEKKEVHMEVTKKKLEEPKYVPPHRKRDKWEKHLMIEESIPGKDLVLSSVEKAKNCKEDASTLQDKLVTMFKNPGTFIFPCQIGGISFNKAYCKLGSSINTMSFATTKLLGIGGALRESGTSILVSDHAIKQPIGVIGNVLVHVDKFAIPTDFVVMNTKESKEAPLILGKPFLTSLIDSITKRKGRMKFEHDGFEEFFLPQEKNSKEANDTCSNFELLENLFSCHKKSSMTRCVPKI